MAEIAQRADVAPIDLIGVGHRRNGSLDTGFSQKMQHGEGRPIGIVFDVFGLAIGKLVLWVKTGDLQLSFQVQLLDRRLAHVEEVVVLDEVFQDPGMDQQHGLAHSGVRDLQAGQLRTKLRQQPGGGPLLTDTKTHAIAAVDALRKRTEVEADDRFFQPAARSRDDFFTGNGRFSDMNCSRGSVRPMMRSLSSVSSSILVTRRHLRVNADATINSSHADSR